MTVKVLTRIVGKSVWSQSAEEVSLDVCRDTPRLREASVSVQEFYFLLDCDAEVLMLFS